MPYLQYLFCEKCGFPNNLDINHESTIRAYIKEGRKETFINPATLIWDYLIYSCEVCKAQYKYTYRDVEKRVRNFLSSLPEKYKERFDEIIEGKESVLKKSKQIEDTRKRIDKVYRSK